MTAGFVQVAPDGSGKQLGNEVVTYPAGTVLIDQNGVQTVTSAPIYLFREHIVNADPVNPRGVAVVTDFSGPGSGDFGLAIRIPPGQADLQTLAGLLLDISTKLDILVSPPSLPQYAVPIIGGLRPSRAGPDVSPIPVSSDIFGRQVILPHAPRDATVVASLTITASTSETTLLAGTDPNVANDMAAILITNTAAAVCEVQIRDTTAGVTVMSLEVPANETRGLSVPGVLTPQTTPGKNWTATCGVSTTSIKIFALFVKNRIQ